MPLDQPGFASVGDACHALALVHLDASRKDPLSSALTEVAHIATSLLEVERFSVWATTEDESAIRLFFLFCRSSGVVSGGTVLHIEDFPSYFAALEGRSIAIEDAYRDDAAREINTLYLEPLGIRALLDAPIYSHGDRCGLVCHEHVGEPRSWSESDRLFVNAVADTVSRLAETHERLRAEQDLRSFRE
jgi:two-component system, cell cycle sensor histidine kinase and response regulator CckA